MVDNFKRASLSAQVVAAIRKGVEEGTWTDFLPSERRLCLMFRVSRPTVREALHTLAKANVIDIQQSRRTRIVAQTSSASAASRLILIITHEPIALMSNATRCQLNEIRAHLAEHGFSTEIFICRANSRLARCKRFETFVQHNRLFCCLLLSPSLKLQQWFSVHSVPALVLGSCHSSIRLPSLDVDYRSLCRHAGGMLLAKGHRRIALLLPDSGLAGDIASEQGFLEAVAQRSSESDARALIIRHNGTAQGISNRLDMFLEAPQPPTAILVAKPQHVFVVVTHLLNRGLAVPDGVSLIARDKDNNFCNFDPAIAHYTFEDEAYNHRLSRLVLQLCGKGHLPTKPNLIYPRYVAGGSVKELLNFSAVNSSGADWCCWAS